MEDQPMVITYWKIRGLAQPLRYMCEYFSIPYKMNYLENKEKWFKEIKPKFMKEDFKFANLPYVEDPQHLGDKKISEQFAIMLHINNRVQRKGFLQDFNTDFFMKYGAIDDLKFFFMLRCYYAKDIEDLKQQFTNDFAKDRKTNKIPVLLEIIGDQKFIGGDEPCALDFYLVEVFDFILTVNKDLELDLVPQSRDRMRQYVNDFFSLKNIKEFLESDRNIKLNFNDDWAVYK